MNRSVSDLRGSVLVRFLVTDRGNWMFLPDLIDLLDSLAERLGRTADKNWYVPAIAGVREEIEDAFARATGGGIASE